MAEIEAIDSKIPATISEEMDTSKKPVAENKNADDDTDKFILRQNKVEKLQDAIVIEDKFGADDPIEASQDDMRRQKAERAKEILERRLINPLNDAQSKFFNITDKIAAIIGEKEKDIREKLSNTYLKLETQVYDLMEKIDASLEQKDHSREKKGKKPEIPDIEQKAEKLDNKLA